MPSDYDKIRADNIREYGEGIRHLSFFGRLYTDRTHFIFELLQNAEDAGASKILFELFEDRLEVRHDGRVFDERDVRGVCGVGEGTKTEDLTQIGKFGIGFKSVYAYTSAPEVHSSDEHFRIEHYVRPYQTPPVEPGGRWTTCFVFSFDAPGLDSSAAHREIADRLQNLSARTLLFLRRIKEIGYNLPGKTGGVYLREEVPRGAARQIKLIGNNNGEDVDEDWLVFERPVQVPNRTYAVHVEIGFRLETNPKDQTESIAKVKDSPLVVYFPTEKPTRLGFLVQGPYRTTPSRDNIPKDDPWNKTLVKQSALLTVSALQHLKDMGFMTVTLLDALPIRMDDFPKESMFYPIFEAVRDALRGQELLPADDGTFVTARNAKLARGAELRKLLTQDQLSSLFLSSDRVKWLTGEITQDRTHDLHMYLMNELDVVEVTPEGFGRRITHTFLGSQTDDWFVELYRYLSGQEALWRSPRWSGDTGGLLRSKPILRLQDNRHEVPFRSDGAPNAFLPPPEETDLPVVKQYIVNNEQARIFLRRLGLSEPDVFDDIVEMVLPKYQRQDSLPISIHEHTADIQKILRAMASDSEAGKKKVFRASQQTPFLRAIDNAGNTSFKKPSEIYAYRGDLLSFFSNANNVWFLDERLPNIPLDSDKWIHLGVARLPRRKLIAHGMSPEEREHSTRPELIENYDLDGLAEFLEDLACRPGFEERKNRSLLLWSYLKDHLEATPRFFKGQYEWFYYSAHYKSFDSLMLRRLRESEWIPTQDQSLAKPGHIVASQLCSDFLGAEELSEVLGIRKDSDQRFSNEEQSRRQRASELGVTLEDIELLKLHSDEFQKWKAAMAAKRGTPAFPTRAVLNRERREEQLSEQLAEAWEKEYQHRDGSVRTTRGTIDPERWLRNQYTNEADQMVCQICKEEMPFRRRDRQYYFEAVEALSRSYFTREHEAQFLALCPLCAAMYNEFVKHDDGAMESFRNALMNSTDHEISLRLGELETSVRFVETHYHDIRKILGAQE